MSHFQLMARGRALLPKIEQHDIDKLHPSVTIYPKLAPRLTC